MTEIIIQQFNDLQIEIYSTYENLLFKANIIGDLLGIEDITSSIKDFDEDEVHIMHLTDSLGRTQETKMLTEQGLYKILMISCKPIAKQFQKWVYNVIKEIRLKENEVKLKEKDKLIEQQQRELLKFLQTYEEVEKIEYLYIFSTDKRGYYKVGRTRITPKKRKDGLQTACVDDIEIIFEYRTHNSIILEDVVHYILDRYRSNSNREHFQCDVNFIKMIIELAGGMVNTLKSAYPEIIREELLEKVNQNVNISSKVVEEEEKEKVCKENDPLLYVEEWLLRNYKKIERSNVQYNLVVISSKELENHFKQEYSEIKGRPSVILKQTAERRLQWEYNKNLVVTDVNGCRHERIRGFKNIIRIYNKI